MLAGYAGLLAAALAARVAVGAHAPPLAALPHRRLQLRRGARPLGAAPRASTCGRTSSTTSGGSSATARRPTSATAARARRPAPTPTRARDRPPARPLAALRGRPLPPRRVADARRARAARARASAPCATTPPASSRRCSRCSCSRPRWALARARLRRAPGRLPAPGPAVDRRPPEATPMTAACPRSSSRRSRCSRSSASASCASTSGPSCSGSAGCCRQGTRPRAAVARPRPDGPRRPAHDHDDDPAAGADHARQRPARVAAVCYFRVVDPAAAVTEIEAFAPATSQIAQTTLRSVLGSADLDQLLAERERLNEELQRIIDEQTEPWGVKVSDRRDQGRRDPRGDAAGDGPPGRGRARAPGQDHQRRGRAPGGREAGERRRDPRPGAVRAAAALPADAARDRRRAELHDRVPAAAGHARPFLDGGARAGTVRTAPGRGRAVDEWTVIRFLHVVALAFFVGGQLVLVVAIVPALRGRDEDRRCGPWRGASGSRARSRWCC